MRTVDLILNHDVDMREFVIIRFAGVSMMYT